MKLSDLAAKPKLVKIAIDDADTIKEYGEALEFYIWDRQPMPVFVKLATIDYTNFGSLTDIVKELILDENGKSIVNDTTVLPTNVLMKAINVVVETLGKSITPPTEKETETSK